MAPLHRAITLVEVDRVALRIGEHLDLDVPRRRQVLLDEHAVVAEARARLAPGGGERRREAGGILRDLHALAAAAGRGLDQHRVSDLLRFAREEIVGLVVAMVAGHQRHASTLHDPLGRGFRSHRRDRRRRRTDEDDAGVAAGTRERLVLRQESIARMDRIRACGSRDRQHARGIEVAFPRQCAAQPMRLVAGLDEQRAGVGIRVDGDRADAHAPRGAGDAHGDLAAVGDQQAAHVTGWRPRWRARRPRTR